MNHKQWASISLCLILILVGMLSPQRVSAAMSVYKTHIDNDAAFSAGNALTPIGAIETTGEVSINGRAAKGKDVLWDGEWLQAPAGSSAVVKLNAIGQVTLTGSTMVRLAVSATATESQRQSRMMIASVLAGEIKVKLDSTAAGYLEAGGTSWLAESGADFQLAVRDGKVDLKTARGQVQQTGAWRLSIPELRKGGKIGQPAIAPSILNASYAAPTSVSSSTLEVKNTGGKVLSKDEQRGSLRNSIQRITNRGVLVGNNPIHLYSSPAIRMIGIIEAAGKMKINGREIRDKDMLWDGELIQAPADAPAKVSLAEIGQVTLSSGSVAKLSTVLTKPGNGTGRRVLAATVLNGEINVRLLPEVRAYVEAGGQAFLAGSNAHFRLRSGGGEGFISAVSGRIQPIGKWTILLSTDLLSDMAKSQTLSSPRQYLIRPAASGNQIGYLTTVRAATTQNLNYQVIDSRGRPAPGLPVVFTVNSLDGKEVATLGHGLQAGKVYKTMTDVNGIATVPFTAGRSAGSASISAMVEGTNSSQNSVVTVPKGGDPFWNKRNAVPFFAVVTAMVVAGIVVAANRDDKLPIKGSGDFIIVP